MNKSRIWIGLLVLFVSGVLIGSVGTRIYIRHKISGIFAGERPVIRDLFFRRLTRQLDLTAKQRQELEEIAGSASEEFHNLHREHRDEAEAFLDSTVSEMKKHLSPEQQEQLDEIRERGGNGGDPVRTVHPPRIIGPLQRRWNLTRRRRFLRHRRHLPQGVDKASERNGTSHTEKEAQE
jgi:hypothetical protein